MNYEVEVHEYRKALTYYSKNAKKVEENALQLVLAMMKEEPKLFNSLVIDLEVAVQREEIDEDIKELLLHKDQYGYMKPQTIAAIRVYRAKTGMSLKGAKDVIDNLRIKLGVDKESVERHNKGTTL